ncbi:FAD-dependent oxidoreductase [Kitasatospora sp. NPDC002227]|uniref:NAD(P)/FAD-dependent oxidoreductase n=1 Tax=Kitasatospora sp. NPDC002227 TaxID=3154773 RepID=UPI003324E7E2
MRAVAVVGGGIVGACAAFHLARAGLLVHCIEAGEVGGGTTAVSFARLSAYQQPTATRFRISSEGIAEYRALARLVDLEPWWHRSGSLVWADADGREALHEHVERMRGWGYQVSWRSAAEVNRSLDPQVRFADPAEPVALLPDEGWVDAPGLAGALLAAAERRHGLLRWRCRAEALVAGGGEIRAVRLADGTELPVDAVVNAAGAGAAALAAGVGVPMLPPARRSGLVVDLKTSAAPPVAVLRGPDLHARAAGPGLVRVRSDQVDALLGPALGRSADHSGDGSGEGSSGGSAGGPGEGPADGFEVPEDLVADLLARARRSLPGLAGAGVERVRVGTAVFPADGHPSVGAVPAVGGYFEALTNSGVTVGPLMGRLLAEYVTGGEPPELLAECRPDRLRA